MRAMLCLYLLLDATTPSPSPPPVPPRQTLPATAKQAHEEGMRLYDRGDYAGALRAYKRGLELEQLLDRGVTDNGKAGVTIAHDPNAPKDEGDFGALELALSLDAAARLTGKQSAAETRSHQIKMLLEILGSSDKDAKPVSDFLQRHYVAFLAEAQRREMLATLAAGA